VLVTPVHPLEEEERSASWQLRATVYINDDGDASEAGTGWGPLYEAGQVRIAEKQPQSAQRTQSAQRLARETSVRSVLSVRSVDRSCVKGSGARTPLATGER